MRDDLLLYHADGTPYLEGDNIDVRGLFLATGDPASLHDFLVRYWAEPPLPWASKFPDHHEWIPRRVIPFDDIQRSAEIIIKTGSLGSSRLVDAALHTVVSWLSRESADLLSNVTTQLHPLRSLNGYATKATSGERAIVVHAGLELVLTNLASCLVHVTKRKWSSSLDLAVRDLARFIHDSRIRSDLPRVLNAASTGSDEAVSNTVDLSLALPYRDAQIFWIVAHECAHHFLGHLERLAAEKEIIPKSQWSRLFSLRREFEFEADDAATHFLLQNWGKLPPGPIGPVCFDAVDMLFSFFRFADNMNGVEYDQWSTHPPAGERLHRLRRRLTESRWSDEPSEQAQLWETYLEALEISQS